MESVIVHVPPADRMAFLAERRALSVQRFDTVHSPHYDRHWGAISATHADFAARLAPHYSEPVAGPTATELLAQDREDRF